MIEKERRESGGREAWDVAFKGDGGEKKELSAAKDPRLYPLVLLVKVGLR
jgi:hypothetical protein